MEPKIFLLTNKLVLKNQKLPLQDDKIIVVCFCITD